MQSKCHNLGKEGGRNVTVKKHPTKISWDIVFRWQNVTEINCLVLKKLGITRSIPEALLRDVLWRKQVLALLRSRANSALSLAASSRFPNKIELFHPIECLWVWPLVSCSVKASFSLSNRIQQPGTAWKAGNRWLALIHMTGLHLFRQQGQESYQPTIRPQGRSNIKTTRRGKWRRMSGQWTPCWASAGSTTSRS
jgi:hypothetical protein